MYNHFLINLSDNKWYTITIIYFLFSCLLKSLTGIDICIPCLWKFVFDFHCPGCGLTTAFIHLLNLEFKSALAANLLIIVVLPLALFYLIFDFLKFLKKQRFGNI